MSFNSLNGDDECAGVFVLDCILIDDMARGNQTEDCSGGRGTLRWFIILWTVPFTLTVCVFGLTTPEINRDLDDFYGPLNAEFQTLLL